MFYIANITTNNHLHRRHVRADGSRQPAGVLLLFPRDTHSTMKIALLSVAPATVIYSTHVSILSV